MVSKTDLTYTHDFKLDPPGDPDVNELQDQLDRIKNWCNQLVDDLNEFTALDDQLSRDSVRTHHMHPEIKAQLRTSALTITDPFSWQMPVLAVGTVTPPVSPADGDRYVVGASATGAWAGEDDNIAEWITDNGAWSFYTTSVGFATYNIDTGSIYYKSAVGWAEAGVIPADLSVTTAKIVDLAVTTPKINDLAVTTAKINDLAVTTAKIDALAVTTAKLADGAVTSPKLNASCGYISAGSTTLRTFIDRGATITNVLDFGAVGDGVADDTAALQAAHNSGGKVIYYPAGTYLVSTAVLIQVGQIVIGQGGSPYLLGTRINNVTPAGSCLALIHTGASTVQESCRIFDISMSADYPVVLNDRTIIVDNGGPQPYLMQFCIKRCSMISRTPAVGVGIQLTKCFDFIVEQCDVSGYDIGILLTGCDLGTVRNCRVTAFTGHGILEFATSTTFGSQNHICGNDIILPTAPTSIFFKSNAFHVSFYDNYMESGIPISGFVDITKTGMPAIFGVNVAADSWSCVAKDNRIDGHGWAINFVYRVAETMVSCRIEDRGTVGGVAAAGKALVIENGYIPVVYGTSHKPEYEFKSEAFGRWSDFHTHQKLDQQFGVHAQTFAALGFEAVNSNGAGAHIRLRYDGIVFLTTMTMVNYWLPVAGPNGTNEDFANGVTYNVYVKAKTMSALGDTIVSGRLHNLVGGAGTNMVLTQQFQEFTFTITGALITDTLGLYFQRSTFNGDVIVGSVVIAP